MPPPNRKSVQQSFLDEFPLPITEGSGKTYIAMINVIKGQSLFEVSLPVDAIDSSSNGVMNHSDQVASNLSVYNNLSKGGYVIIILYKDPTTKILGQIENVLFDPQIRHIKKHGLWPSAFNS